MTSLVNMSSEQVLLAIQPIIKGLNDVKPVNNDIIENTRYDLEEGLQQLLEQEKISPTTYQDMVKQNKEELEYRIAAGELIDQQLERLEKLKAEASETNHGFSLPSTTSRDDLKKLIALMQIKSALTEDKSEKLLFTTLLQTVMACKNFLDEKGSFDTKTIPLLDSEEQYVSSLLEQMKDFTLDRPKAEAIDNYLEQFNALDSIKNKCMNDPSISDDEKMILGGLCDNLSGEVRQVLDTLMTPGGEIDEERITQKISDHLDRSLAQSKDIPITSGFRGFVNSICEVIKAEPLFTISNSPIIDKMKSMKTELFALKGNDEEVNEVDEERSLLRNP